MLSEQDTVRLPLPLPLLLILLLHTLRQSTHNLPTHSRSKRAKSQTILAAPPNKTTPNPHPHKAMHKNQSTGNPKRKLTQPFHFQSKDAPPRPTSIYVHLTTSREKLINNYLTKKISHSGTLTFLHVRMSGLIAHFMDS